MSVQRHLLATAVALALAPAAWAQNTAGTATPTALDTVIVTGTYVTDRTVAESQSPIDIITPRRWPPPAPPSWPPRWPVRCPR